jgi:putative DNA primase/helicase
MIQETTGVDIPITENIPEELAERPQWVLWHLEERAGKLTKVPYTDTGHRASSTDLMTWTTCAMACAAYERGNYDGIGFVFSSADPFVGIDLDDCRDPESGVIKPWAQRIIDRVREGYVEISPSGSGIHIIVEGSVREGRTRKEVHEQGERIGRVEMYGRAKFFTITGRVL